MPLLNWIAAVRELGAAALTVQAQAVDPTLQNALLWDQFMPRRDVDSTEIDVLLEELEVEYTSDRREWNQRGRPIPMRSPGTKRYEMVPIEDYFHIREKEIQDLMNRFNGNRLMVQAQIAPRIPERTLRLVRANYRRIEKDTFDVWSSGTLTRRNPQLGHALTTLSYGISSTRYPTVGTAWNNVGLNAFNEFIAMIATADKMIGVTQGCVMRQATWNEIQADASAAISVSTTFPILRLSRAEVEARITQEIRREFVVIIFEDTLTVFNDGGVTNTTEVARWPVGRIGFIPRAGGGAVGYNAFAPVLRAWDLTDQAPDAGIDVRGMTVYHDVEDTGRGLDVQCQVNAMPIPIEERIFVPNVGV